MYTHVDDTIVAIASPPGCGPRGIVRLSGPNAIAIAAAMFQPAQGDWQLAQRSTATPGMILLDERCRVRGWAYLFRAPHSYTRQDVIELHTVGSPPLLEMLLERCIRRGARLAEPGEFTARAFLCGALGLSQAEAVAATIRARSDHQLRAARRMMQGDLSRQTVQWASELADLLALVTADIDFSEEPIDFINPQEMCHRLTRLIDELNRIIDAAVAQQRCDVMPHVLLLGPPNAGKSTLMNRLSNMDRSIISAVSGTTRDILAAPVRFGQIQAILLDAAGIDDDPDEVIRAARGQAIEAASAVECVCIVVDVSQEVSSDQLHGLLDHCAGHRLLVGNKIDLVDADRAAGRQAFLEKTADIPVCMVSARSGQGLDAVRTRVAAMLGGRDEASESAAIGINLRQRQALEAARDALQACQTQVTDAASTLDVAELVALDLREALDALSAITGEVTTEDLLGRIFASFCIGK